MSTDTNTCPVGTRKSIGPRITIGENGRHEIHEQDVDVNPRDHRLAKMRDDLRREFPVEA